VNIMGPDPIPLEQLIRGRVTPAGLLLAAGVLVLSLLLAFRRERLRGSGPPIAEPRLPEALREVRLFRLQYGVAFETGRLRAGERSPRRRLLETPSRSVVSWRPPEVDFPAEPDRPLGVLSAGGRAIATLDPATRRIAFHEADLAQLHGLGRRGRVILLWPVFLATAIFAVLTRVMLGDFLSHGAGMSAHDVRLSLVVAAALFAFAAFLPLAAILAGVSALLRRVRRSQLRRDYEPALRAFLASAADDAVHPEPGT
jgi:hypothetical protein